MNEQNLNNPYLNRTAYASAIIYGLYTYECHSFKPSDFPETHKTTGPMTYWKVTSCEHIINIQVPNWGFNKSSSYSITNNL